MTTGMIERDTTHDMRPVTGVELIESAHTRKSQHRHHCKKCLKKTRALSVERVAG